MNILGLDSLHFETDRLNRVRTFYEDYLGFLPFSRVSRSRTEPLRIRSGRSHLSFFRTTGRLSDHSRRNRGFRRMSWSVDGLAALRSRWTNLGGKADPIRPHPSGQALHLSDPDGFAVALIERAPHASRESEPGWALCRGIDHVRLDVSDMQASFDFYRRLLSVRVRWVCDQTHQRCEWDGQGPVPEHIGVLHLAVSERTYISLGRAADPRRPRFVHMGWEVQDAVAGKALLRDHTVPAKGPSSSYQGRHLYVRDPNLDGDGECNLELTEYLKQPSHENSPRASVR